MVTLSNTWTTSLNNVPTQDTLQHQGQTTLFALKQALVAAGYVIVISSNGTTLSTNGTDNWATSADVVWNTAGSAHSYFTVKSPSGMLPSSNQAHILVDCGVGATSYHLVNITFASAAFTSSGSVNTIPTAPSNAVAFSNKQYLHSTVVNSKYHYQYVTGGTEIGNFFFHCSQDGTSRIHFTFAFLMSHGAESGDNWPCVGVAAFQETGNGAPILGNLTSSSHTAQYHFDATMATVAKFIVPWSNGDGADMMGSFTSLGSSITGVYPDFPVVLADTTTGKLTVRGYLVDVAWAPIGTASMTGTVEPASGSSTTTIFGELWLPNGNVTLLI